MTGSELFDQSRAAQPPQPPPPPAKVSPRRIALEILAELKGIHATARRLDKTMRSVLEELQERPNSVGSDLDRELIDEQTRPGPRETS